MYEAIAALTAALPLLPEKDFSFAASLIDQFQAKGSLSEKQMYWVRKLSAAVKPAATPTNLGDFSAVIALFRTASQNLKHPKVRLQMDDGRPVVLSVAGASAKAPGTVNITDGRSFGNNTWYGRVSPDGAWDMSRKVDAGTATALTALLTTFAADPAATAAAYGHLVGSCCFCQRTLTDKRSIKVGYGPVCAGNFNLPWGA